MNQIADKIREYFDGHLDSLPQHRQHQYASRMYRITAEDKYIAPIKNFLAETENKIKYYADNLENAKKEGEKILEENKKLDWYKKMNRLSIYSKFPEARFYHKIIFELEKALEYRGEKILNSPEYKKCLSFLRTISFEEFLLDKEIIKNDPSQTINYVYWLNNLGVCDLRESYAKELLAIFPTNRLFDDDLDFHNQIYGYTHYVIAESDYYQHSVEKDKFKWLIEFFDTNFEAILKRADNDMIAEIGASLKILGVNNEVLEKVKQHLMSKFNGTYVPQKDYTELEKLQHTNMLAIIVLTDFTQFFKGPHIS